MSEIDELAIACNLSAAELEERGADLLPGLLAVTEAHEPVENGYRLTFTAEHLPTVFDVVKSERECCPFFRFDLTVEPAAGPVFLTLSGPPGTREFIEMFIAART